MTSSSSSRKVPNPNPNPNPLLPDPNPLPIFLTSSSSPSRKALSKIACNRLQKELAEWQVNPPAGFKHKVTDNLQRWAIVYLSQLKPLINPILSGE